jgi:hypothetical protein
MCGAEPLPARIHRKPPLCLTQLCVMAQAQQSSTTHRDILPVDDSTRLLPARLPLITQDPLFARVLREL